MLSQKINGRIFFILTLIFIITLGVMIFITQNRTNEIVSELTLKRAQEAKQGLIGYLEELNENAVLRAELISRQEPLIAALREYTAAKEALSPEELEVLNTALSEGDYDALKIILSDEIYGSIQDVMSDFLSGFDFISICDADGISLGRTDNGEREYPLPERGYSLRFNSDMSHVLDTGEGMGVLTFMMDSTFVASALYPIYDGDRLVGAISLLYDFSNNKYLDAFRKRNDCEVAVFLGPERIMTTLTDQSGKRVTERTQVAKSVSDAIFERGEEYYLGFIDLYGKTYGAHYSPLTYHEEVIGLLFTGVDVTAALKSRQNMNTGMLIAFALSFVVMAAFILYSTKYGQAIAEIYEKKAAIEQLRDSDARTQLMLNSSPLGILFIDSDYNVLDCNQEALDMFGVADKEEYKTHFKEYFPEYQPNGERSEPTSIGHLSEAFKNDTHKFEWMHLRADGEPLPCEVTIVCSAYKEQKFAVIYLRDMRDIKELNELRAVTAALEKQFERQALMRQISQSFLSDEDLNLLITNALHSIGEFMGFTQIFLYEHEENNTYVCTNEWIAAEHKDKDYTNISGKFVINEMFRKIFVNLKARGRTYLTSADKGVKEAMTSYPVKFPNYLTAAIQVDGFLYAFMNYSKAGSEKWSEEEINTTLFISSILSGAFQRRSIEEQLVRAKVQAEESNRSKGIFLASMSHEIRTPMNAILGIAEIRLQDKNISKRTEEAFNKICDSGNLLINIINDILDFSKIEAGKMEIIPVKYDIPSLINDTVQLNRLRFENKPIEFKLKVDENTPFELFGDVLRIKQILNNLLTNAFKYTASGEVVLSVHSETPPPLRENGEAPDLVALVFSVKDTGQGMNKSQVSRLFAEYTRFNLETNRAVAGTGLGLTITKRLLDIMNGEIFVESEPGKGSVFTVRLPQKRIGEEICGPELSDKIQHFDFQSTSRLQKTRFLREYMPYGSVLVVDDVESNLYVASGILELYGLDVDTASGGNEAIAKVKSGKVYDIIFMDHMMPKPDGMETTKIIRESGYKRPIVALTANAVTGQAEMFLQNGFDQFISKPIDTREMNAILNKLIRDKQTPEVLAEARRLKEQLDSALRNESERGADVISPFLRDGEKAVAVLKSITPDENDLHDYITAVHGMKSALANVGEAELSKSAATLEKAANERDMAVINAQTPAFIKALRETLGKLKPKDERDITLKNEDSAYLRDKLEILKNACAELDKKTAKGALHDLKERALPAAVKKDLDSVSALLLHSDFDDAAKEADLITAKYARAAD